MEHRRKDKRDKKCDRLEDAIMTDGPYAYIDDEPTSRGLWSSSARTPVPLVSLVLSLGSPILATAMACSDDCALGRAPTRSGPDCSTRCRTLGLLASVLLWLGLRGRWCRRRFRRRRLR